MSLCSTFVQADDGLWYRNPVVEGKGWFVCWDDDDPIELVVQAKDKPEADRKAAEVIKLIEANGGKLTITSRWHGGMERNFGHYDFHPARCCWVEFRSVPASMLRSDDPPMISRPKRDCVFYPNEP